MNSSADIMHVVPRYYVATRGHNFCILHRTFEIIIIACSIVGGLLILTVIFIVLCVCYIRCCRTKGTMTVVSIAIYSSAANVHECMGIIIL